jgi:hypothetical protein
MQVPNNAGEWKTENRCGPAPQHSEGGRVRASRARPCTRRHRPSPGGTGLLSHHAGFDWCSFGRLIKRPQVHGTITGEVQFKIDVAAQPLRLFQQWVIALIGGGGQRREDSSSSYLSAGISGTASATSIAITACWKLGIRRACLPAGVTRDDGGRREGRSWSRAANGW